MNMGNAQLHPGDLQGVIEAYGSAIAVQPAYALTYINLAFALSYADQYEGVFEAVHDALSFGAAHRTTFSISHEIEMVERVRIC